MGEKKVAVTVELTLSEEDVQRVYEALGIPPQVLSIRIEDDDSEYPVYIYKYNEGVAKVVYSHVITDGEHVEKGLESLFEGEISK